MYFPWLFRSDLKYPTSFTEGGETHVDLNDSLRGLRGTCLAAAIVSVGRFLTTSSGVIGK